jgi:hypothetical protein
LADPSKLMTRTVLRLNHIRSSYDRVVGTMVSSHPEVYDQDDDHYSFEKYMRALLTIQVGGRATMLQGHADHLLGDLNSGPSSTLLARRAAIASSSRAALESTWPCA